MTISLEIFLKIVEIEILQMIRNKFKTTCTFITEKRFQPILVTTVFQVSSDFHSLPQPSRDNDSIIMLTSESVMNLSMVPTNDSESHYMNEHV